MRKSLRPRLCVCAGRIPLITFVMQSLKFDVLFAVLPCTRLPPYFRHRPLDVIDEVASMVRSKQLSVLPHGAGMYDIC